MEGMISRKEKTEGSKQKGKGRNDYKKRGVRRKEVNRKGRDDQQKRGDRRKEVEREGMIRRKEETEGRK